MCKNESKHCQKKSVELPFDCDKLLWFDKKKTIQVDWNGQEWENTDKTNNYVEGRSDIG